jgi:hypothetical protein
MCVVGSARRRAFKKYNRPLASQNVIGEIIGAPRTWPTCTVKSRCLIACGITAAKGGSSQQNCDWRKKSEPLVSDAGLVSKSAIGKKSGSAAPLDLNMLAAGND